LITASAWWFRHQTRALLRRIEDPRWNTVLAVAPDVEGLNSCIWPAHLSRVSQGRGDLGDRMSRILRGLSKGPLCIIGADIMKRARPPRTDILNNVRWSSEHALTDSARSLGDLSIAQVATLRDVDTVDDLRDL